MGLLDGGLAAIFSSAFGEFYLDATLFRAATSADGKGGGSSSFDTGTSVKAQVDKATYAMQQSDNYVDGDQRILVLAYGVDPIDTDCEIVVAGNRWKVAGVEQDPAVTHYALWGRRA